MIDKTKAIIGQTVFFEEHWSNNIIKGIISEIHDDGARIKCNSFPDTYSCKWENLYPTKLQGKTAQYEKEITDVESLVKFALNHSLCAEEYTDYAAMEAYKRHSKDLLGIEL